MTTRNIKTVKIWNKKHKVRQPTWTALFTAGQCASCTYAIRKGQVITRDKDDNLVHYACVHFPVSF